MTLNDIRHWLNQNRGKADSGIASVAGGQKAAARQSVAGQEAEREVRQTDDPIDYASFGGEPLRPSDYDKTLRDKDARGEELMLYWEIENDTRIGALLEQRKDLSLGKSWSILPRPGAGRVGRRAAQTLDDWARHQINFDEALSAALDDVLYGASYQELMFAARDGLWLPRALRAAPPWRFAYLPDSWQMRLLTRDAPSAGREIWPGKIFCTYNERKFNSPFGKSLGRRLWWLRWFRTEGIKFWLRLADRYGAPVAVAKYPSGASVEERRRVRLMLAQFRRDSGVMLPEQFSLELTQASAGGPNDLHERLLRYIDEECAISILGEVKRTNSGAGSRSSEEVHERTGARVGQRDQKRFAAHFNVLLRALTCLNWGDDSAAPVFQFDYTDIDAQNKYAQRDKTLFALGIIPADVRAHAARLYGIETAASAQDVAAAAGVPDARQATDERADGDEEEGDKNAAEENIAEENAAEENVAEESEDDKADSVSAADDSAARRV